MSAFADALRDTSAAVHGMPCSVGDAREQMPQDARAELDAALDIHSGISSKRIHTALQSLGYPVGMQTVGRHRRGDCRCFRG